jgi:GR25 family glycosyltransferase involved in LPS biosynthesis
MRSSGCVGAAVQPLVIDFDEIPSGLRDALSALQLPAPLHRPAVRALQDARWASRQSSPPWELGAGAAGCLLAHVDTWRWWATNAAPGDVALVLEADAQLTSYGLRWFEHACRMREERNVEFLQVGSNRSEQWTDLPKEVRGIQNGLTVAKEVFETRWLKRRSPLLSDFLGWGTHAYLITNGFARVLSNQPPQFLMPLDAWLRALSWDSRYSMRRVRQQLWTTSYGPSVIDELGR